MKEKDWIEWTSKKADFCDSTIARDDEFPGVREHGKDEEYKKIQGYWR
ncbi:MAG: hypothetical protein KMY55_10955 [Dethiosulfatibacter sp.]|nr:hypothetical protein [Dethiosulfatibacter sp.]